MGAYNQKAYLPHVHSYTGAVGGCIERGFSNINADGRSATDGIGHTRQRLKLGSQGRSYPAGIDDSGSAAPSMTSWGHLFR